MTKIIGILNYNDNSFSDGGDFNNLKAAIARIEYLTAKGADFIDIGCAATSYGAKLISADAEWQKLEKLLKNIDLSNVSIDSYNYKTIEKSLELGVKVINDVSGGKDPRILQLISKYPDVLYISMFSLVLPADKNIRIKSIDEVFNWAENMKKKCLAAGMIKKQIILDPGIGFVTNAEQSIELIKRVKDLTKFGVSLCVGHSRKSFIHSMANFKAAERDIETLAISLFLKQSRIEYIRVHNVEMHRRAFNIADEIYV